jgi:hypothetical protein
MWIDSLFGGEGVLDAAHALGILQLTQCPDQLQFVTFLLGVADNFCNIFNNIRLLTKY